jgi:hypothetical protein
VAVTLTGADPWHAAPNDPALKHMKHNGVRCAFAIDDARRAS